MTLSAIARLKTSCLLFVASAVISVSAAATTIIYSSGHTINTTAAAAGGVTLAGANPAGGFPAASLAAAIGDGHTGIFGAYDALVLGEDLSDFSASDKTAIAAFTTAGGHLVVLGAHGDGSTFLNSLFGYTMTDPGLPCCDHAVSNRVAGTGPATLLSLNGSVFVNGAPGTVLYQHVGGGESAFISAVGTGTVSFLAWDFCDCGEPVADQTAWYSVMGTAAIGSGPKEVPTLSTLAAGLLIAMLALVGLRGMRRTA